MITHARTRKARFLGYGIWTDQVGPWHTKGRRSTNGIIALGVPPETVNTRCRTYQRAQGKPLIRNDLIRTSDRNIVASADPVRERRCFEATQRTPSGTVFTPGSVASRCAATKHARLIDGAWTARRGRRLIAPTDGRDLRTMPVV